MRRLRWDPTVTARADVILLRSGCRNEPHVIFTVALGGDTGTDTARSEELSAQRALLPLPLRCSALGHRAILPSDGERQAENRVESATNGGKPYAPGATDSEQP